MDKVGELEKEILFLKDWSERQEDIWKTHVEDLKSDRLKWTKKLPNKEGWYWMAWAPLETTMVYYWAGSISDGGKCWEIEEIKDAKYAGPIKEPDNE